MANRKKFDVISRPAPPPPPVVSAAMSDDELLAANAANPGLMDTLRTAAHREYLAARVHSQIDWLKLDARWDSMLRDWRAAMNRRAICNMNSEADKAAVVTGLRAILAATADFQAMHADAKASERARPVVPTAVYVARVAKQLHPLDVCETATF